MAPQHDEHCWVTFAGENWRIASVRGPVLHLLRGEQGPWVCEAWLNVAHVRWPDYVAACRRILGVA